MAFLTALPGFASFAAKAAMDMLFPPRCFSCDALTGNAHGLCAACWEGIDFISAPYCLRCGTPFPHEMGGPAVECMPCLTTPPPYARARAVFCYDERSRRIVTGYKYHDRTQATPMLSQWLQRAGQDIGDGIDGIVAVPLHRWRLIRRRYNQSALLAEGLARLMHKPVLRGALGRTRHTRQQAGLTREERLTNVEGAFAVPLRHAGKVQGKRLLLVDDVLTTGATLNACTEALLAAGAAEVRVLTLARTVGDEI